MGMFGVGQSVRRIEDRRLLTGLGRYTDDIALPRQAFGYVVRSPHAHARIARLDPRSAREAEGVLAVLTAKEVIAENLGTLPCAVALRSKDGSPLVTPVRQLLQGERARFVGDPVAFIVAETLQQARDAAELFEVEYEDLPSISSTKGALAPQTPRVWENAPDNVCFDWTLGDKVKTDEAFAMAKRIIRLEFINNRIVPNSMETRSAIGDYDPATGKSTLYTSSQGTHALQAVFSSMLGIPKEKLRVVTPDVGGGFGMKFFPYPEQALVLWAAKRLKRAVRWTSERSEAFLADSHGRDNVTLAEIAVDESGRFLALRVSTIANLGAYLSYFGPYIPTVAGANMVPGVYDFKSVFVEVKGVFTNTTPTDAYRGAGRPEAAYLIERIVDYAARELGVSPYEIRRRNFVKPTAMPYITATGNIYDTGDFARALAEALKQADWDGCPSRKTASRKSGKLRGIGLAYYIERCGAGFDDRALVRFEPNGDVSLYVGSISNGQGHETAFSQLAADRFGIDIARVKVIQGDTDAVEYGNGTGGSRALAVQGSAVVLAADKVLAKAKDIAAHLLEANSLDLAFSEGVFSIAGTDRHISFDDVLKAAFDPAKRPPGMPPGLEDKVQFLPAAPTYPNGCHICEVEIDEATGATEVVRYTIVDDFGVILNPLMLEGQIHGGVAQGIGQALLEHTVYDEASGQLLAGSFMDYNMPRADNIPMIDFLTKNIPTTANPLGVKGAGEAGAIGAPPAVINAVVDALAEFGVRHVDMPATAERLWALIHGAHRSRAA
ncbi:MAG TPA: xanthine dehydrogenase family protein molybdopterin-binding subunit [Alphaproteobacteria bacterium]|nr:xanthine dehydrogenase family protein molybdopterin-binding subunit [Alphaproteobacteria bacterium]